MKLEVSVLTAVKELLAELVEGRQRPVVKVEGTRDEESQAVAEVEGN